MLSKKTSKISAKKDLRRDCMKFIDAGIVCYAVCLLDDLGIVNDLLNRKFIEKNELEDDMYNNPITLKSAIKTLCLNGVLIDSGTLYILSDFGAELLKNIGFINLLYGSYSELLSKGISVSRGNIKDPCKLINYDKMAQASDQLGSQEDDLILKVLKRLGISGGICDLGCGSGKRLTEICDYFKVYGLGLDKCKMSIMKAKENYEKENLIHFQVSNVEHIKDVWHEIEIVMQCFMTHDIFPSNKLLRVLKSYLRVFPNVKYMVILDVVSAERYEMNSISAPGLDFIHGLQNKEVYNKNDLLEIFQRAGYKKIIELNANPVPNSYIWVFSID